nr:hypothetical protein [Streptomyces sp. HYC2]
MTAGWCSRTVRAALFAAVCTVSAALGHVMMSGTAVPWWAMTAGAVATGGMAWWPAGRERGSLLVSSVAVAVQALLHSWFSLTQALTDPALSGGRPLAQRWFTYLLCGTPPAPGARYDAMPMPMGSMPSMGSGTGAMHSMRSMNSVGLTGLTQHHTGSAGSLGHDMGGMSPIGMLAAHLLAALLCGVWLAYGERAVFRILRAFAGWLFAPLRLFLRPPTPPHRPCVRPRRAGSDRPPHRILPTHAITTRGPPARTAVA